MTGHQECHYRGIDCPPCRIVPYAPYGRGTVMEDAMGEYNPLVFIHLEKDMEKYIDKNIVAKDKLLSFKCDTRGLTGYRVGNKLFLTFNFHYFQSLMLINNGKGAHACFSNGNTRHRVYYTFDEVEQRNYSRDIVNTISLEELNITSEEAISIVEAMECLESGKDSYSPAHFVEEYELELPLWQQTKQYLKNLISKAA